MSLWSASSGDAHTRVADAGAESRRDDESTASELNSPCRLHGPRLDFTFDGELDDVAVDDADTLAQVARTLVAHSDRHTGGAAALHITRVGPRLRLQWSDPECSSDCLRGAGSLSQLEHPAVGSTDGTSLVLEHDSRGGLRLEWTLLKPPRPTTRKWFPFAGRGSQKRRSRPTRATPR